MILNFAYCHKWILLRSLRGVGWEVHGPCLDAVKNPYNCCSDACYLLPRPDAPQPNQGPA